MSSGAGTGLHAHLGVRRGSFALDLHLDVAPGAVVALLGPNGAGKSTTLGALAGLQPLTHGHIRIGGRAVDSPADGVFVPPEHRGIGVVFQDYLLFGHLTVAENVAFGLRARGVGRREVHRRVGEWLDRVGLPHLAESRPAHVSGGQAQRVALARALVTDPTLLLLDEPLAALDAATRLEIRSDLRHHLTDYAGCTVLVTHDPLDAMVLADDVVIVEQGRAVQRGAPADVARAPRTEYVARLVGLNLYRGRAAGTAVTLDDGGVLHTAEPAHGPVFVSFPPSAVAVHRERPGGSPRNVWSGRVAGLEQYADTVRVRVAGSPEVLADITTGAVAELRLGAGEPVWVAVKATEVHTYPA